VEGRKDLQTFYKHSRTPITGVTMRPVSGLAIMSPNFSPRMKQTDDYAAGNPEYTKGSMRAKVSTVDWYCRRVTIGCMLPTASSAVATPCTSKRSVGLPTCALRAVILLPILIVCCVTSDSSENTKAERHRAEQILNIVARDVRDNFYDESLKGLDWAALTEQARQRIRSAEQLGEMYGAISALLYQLHDSHTAFIPPKRKIKAAYGFEAKPFGNKIFVYQLDKDGPAAKAGLQLGDQIVGVNNLNAVRETFFDMMRYLTIIDPRVELDVEVAQNGTARMVKIPATIIPQPPQYFFSFIETGRDSDSRDPFYDYKDYGDGIGYLHVRSFVMPSTEIVGMIKPLRHARGAILDLRGNAGGRLSTMVDFMGQFVNEPFELGNSISRRKSEPIRVKPLSPRIACPLVVLLDGASASASEMFARSMQVHKRAILIGDRSSGRVNSAVFFWEPPGSWEGVEFGTEIAVAKIVMEDNVELEGRGVNPDELCIPSPDDLRGEKDPCLDRALATLRVAKLMVDDTSQ
jgi:C-terminal processing protease CtpA/Prc